jgi:hypothetical protein
MNHVKLISLITAIIVLFGTLTASADMTPANEEQKLITEELSADDTGFFSSSSVSLYSSDSNTIPEEDPIVQKAVSILNSETFENTIVDALNSGKTSINVSDMEIPIYVQTSNAELCSYIYKAAQDKFFDIVYSHPEIIHSVTSVGVSMSYFPGNSTGIISSITTSYLNDLNTNESRTLFNNWCSRIISTLINDDMEDYDKALILHDYLAKTVEYNMNAVSSSNNQLTSVDTHARSAYGAIVDKTAVCQGYALAYAHLLSLVGIESEFVTSDYMNHAWNMVKIDNDFYHVDVTYDDPVNTSNEDAGLVSHEYFLRSDESISSSLSSDQKNGVRSPHYGWSTYDSISCSNSAFDTNLIDNSDDVYSFRRTRQEMKYNDGKYYYIQNSYPIEYAVSYFNGSDLELLNDSSMYDSIDTTVELNAKASPSPTPSIEVQPPSPSPSADVQTPSPTPSIEVQSPSPSPSADVQTPLPTPSIEVQSPSPSPSADVQTPLPTASAQLIDLSSSVFGNSAVLSSKMNGENLMCKSISFTYLINSDNDILLTKYNTMTSIADCTINIEGDAAQNEDGSILLSNPDNTSIQFEYVFEYPILSSELPELVRLYVQGLSGNDHNIGQELSVKLDSADIIIHSADGDKEIKYIGSEDDIHNLYLKQYQTPDNDYLKMTTKQSIVIDRENNNFVYYKCEFIPDENDIDEIINNSESYKIYLAEYSSDGTLIGIRSDSYLSDNESYNYYQVPETWLENGNIVKVFCLKDTSQPLAPPIICDFME